MVEIIVSVVVFHTLSCLLLLAGCAVAAVLPMPRRATAPVWVDSMELNADAILSAPVPAPAAVSHLAPERVESASVVAA